MDEEEWEWNKMGYMSSPYRAPNPHSRSNYRQKQKMTTSPSLAPEMNFMELGEKVNTECDGSPLTCLGQETHIGWDGPRILEACSEALKSSSSSSSVLSSDDSPEPVTDEDCAGILLACLHCRFHEFTHLLVDTLDRAVGHCFPSVNHVTESIEGNHQGWECLTCNLGLDWNFCHSCQDSAELLELAMEISEVCYR